MNEEDVTVIVAGYRGLQNLNSVIGEYENFIDFLAGTATSTADTPYQDIDSVPSTEDFIHCLPVNLRNYADQIFVLNQRLSEIFLTHLKEAESNPHEIIDETSTDRLDAMHLSLNVLIEAVGEFGVFKNDILLGVESGVLEPNPKPDSVMTFLREFPNNINTIVEEIQTYLKHIQNSMIFCDSISDCDCSV